MNIQTNYDYIPNLKHSHLIFVDGYVLDFGPLKHTLTISVENYFVEQVIEAVCQNVKLIDMIFYSVIEKKLIFCSSVPMNKIGKNVDEFLEEYSENRRERYQIEAEKFVKKMEELCESKNNISSQEFSLKRFLDGLIENYQKEVKHIHELEKKWNHIMIANHIIRDKDSTYGCTEGIHFDYFEDGRLSFHVTFENECLHFFVPSDFEKTTVKKTDLWKYENEYVFLGIQEEETALRIFSLIMEDLLELYKHCESKRSIYSIMKNHSFPDRIFYQEYEIRISILDSEFELQRVSLKVSTKEMEIVTIDFPFYAYTTLKRNLFTKLFHEKEYMYDNYTIITANIRQYNYLKRNLLNVLNRIRIDRKFLDKIEKEVSAGKCL